MEPFTPDTASSMLSLMGWEKFRSTPGITLSLLIHRIDQFIFGEMRLPVVFGIKQHVEFVVVKAGDVGAVVGAAGLRGDDLDLGECP